MPISQTHRLKRKKNLVLALLLIGLSLLLFAITMMRIGLQQHAGG